MIFDLFKRKKTELQQDDWVMMKRKYQENFPSIPESLALKVVKIDQEIAVVVFMNFSGTGLFTEAIPVDALYRLN